MNTPSPSTSSFTRSDRGRGPRHVLRSPGWLALLLAVTGALIAAVLSVAFGMFQAMLCSAAPQLTVGLVSLLGAAYLLGSKWSHFVGRDRLSAATVGIGLGYAVLLSGLLAGTGTSVLLAPGLGKPSFSNLGESVFIWIVKPTAVALAFGTPAVVALGIVWGSRIRQYHAIPESRSSKRKMGIVLAGLLTTAGLVLLSGWSSEEQVTHRMRWGIASPEDEKANRVTLVFVDYPNYYNKIESPELIDYLEAHGPTVQVTFSVHRSLGEVVGTSTVAIAGFSGEFMDGSAGVGCGGQLLPPCGDQPSEWRHQDSPWGE